ncbi:MAG: hypothetical protein ACRDOU_06270 [Streptosporangiaceae bacterium]
MFINPEISRQLADQHRSDLLADAQQQSLARQARTATGTTTHRQPLSYRLWRRLRPVTTSRPVTSPRLEPQA